VSADIATPIFFLIFIAVLALFPELVVILSAPAVIAGFNVLLGVSIAAPIVQSIIRHVEAGGFGEDDGYDTWIYRNIVLLRLISCLGANLPTIQ
jgi:hypothetical protein